MYYIYIYIYIYYIYIYIYKVGQKNKKGKVTRISLEGLGSFLICLILCVNFCSIYVTSSQISNVFFSLDSEINRRNNWCTKAAVATVLSKRNYLEMHFEKIKKKKFILKFLPLSNCFFSPLYVANGVFSNYIFKLNVLLARLVNLIINQVASQVARHTFQSFLAGCGEFLNAPNFRPEVTLNTITNQITPLLLLIPFKQRARKGKREEIVKKEKIIKKRRSAL